MASPGVLHDTHEEQFRQYALSVLFSLVSVAPGTTTETLASITWVHCGVTDVGYCLRVVVFLALTLYSSNRVGSIQYGNYTSTMVHPTVTYKVLTPDHQNNR